MASSTPLKPDPSTPDPSRPAAADPSASPPEKHGYLGDEVPGLVPPSELNQGDTGVANDKPQAGGELDFDDGSMWERGKNVRTGGTWAAHGADSAPLGPPAEIFSDNNQPSDQPGRPEGARSDGESA
jgi:hypothetical protein